MEPMTYAQRMKAPHPEMPAVRVQWTSRPHARQRMTLRPATTAPLVVAGTTQSARGWTTQLQEATENQVLGNSNNSSIAGGSSNTIAGSAAVFGAIGGGASNIVAAGTTGATVAGGSNNQAAADYSTVPGGRRGFAERHGEFAYNVGPTSGKNQTGFCLARKLTTDATKAEAFLDGVSEQMTLSTGDALKMRVEVIASDETTSKHAIWTVDNLLIHRNGAAASTSLVGGSTGIVPDVSVGTGSGWRLDLTADTTNAAIRVEVTGEAAVSIEWTVRISYIQVKTNGV